MTEVDAGVHERFDEFCVRLSHGEQMSDSRIADGRLSRPTAVQRAIRNPLLRNSFRAARAKAAAKSLASPWGLVDDRIQLPGGGVPRSGAGANEKFGNENPRRHLLPSGKAIAGEALGKA
jgi:hypothetical protein